MTEVLSVADYRQVLRKRPKYHNRKVEIDGYKFDSLKESRRYLELLLMLKAGEIRDFKVHPQYDFWVNSKWVGSYRADFSYKNRQSFDVIVEDVKSTATKRARDWPLRRNLMRAIYGIEVIEI